MRGFIKTASNLDQAGANLRNPAYFLTANEVDKKIYRERFVEGLSHSEVGETLDDFLASKAGDHFVSILARAPYLADLSCRFPDVIAACLSTSFFDVVTAQLNILNERGDQISEADLSSKLRSCKQKISLATGLADLSGCWSSDKVGQTITATADACLNAAIDHLLIDYHHRSKIALPDIENPRKGCGYTVVAMGKHGAHELNYSSDIDIIVFIDPDAPAIIEREETVATFTRLTKTLVKLMQEQTAEGYAFRTDLRLRPDPGSMPLAIPIMHAMHYYESRGQNWERAAMIKARTVAGDIALGNEILGMLKPFVWRRYLDYAAISDIHSIKRQLQAHRDYNDLAARGHNVKLGRGGIREIEFFVQTQQLVAGGRIEELRAPATLEMLDRLADHKWIEPLVRDELKESYRFLRDVEHRLQMVRDEQTHIVPSGEAAFANIAALCAMEPKVFEKTLIHHLERVERHYAHLFANEPTLSVSGNLSFTGDEADPGTVDTLQSLGFQRPSDMIAVVKGWHFGRYRAMQTVESRERLTEVTPVLLEAFSATGNPDETLLAFDDFLRGLPAGFQLMNMLRAKPKLMELLVLILGVAPRLAAIVTRKPHVFDALLEPGFFNNMPSEEELRERLTLTLNQASAYEDMLDRARLFVAEQKFLIGVRVLVGTCPPNESGKAFSLLAEVCVQVLLEFVQREFEVQHGQVPNAEFAVVSMGNLGTRELTAGSDLDLITLYKFDADNDESNGPRPLHVFQYFSRLTQRLTAAMSAPTGEGVVYELDFRLRPSGNAGPLATTLTAFKRYQEEEAWTWERLALSRSRTIAGEPAFCSEIDETIRTLIETRRDFVTESKDVLEMRELMDKEREAASPWDVKLATGGLIDLEFLAQTAVLAGECKGADLTRPALIKLESELNAPLREAYDLYTTILQLSRITQDGVLNPDKASKGFIELLLRAINMPDLATAEVGLVSIQEKVRTAFLAKMKPV